jgi:hypothetical protein
MIILGTNSIKDTGFDVANSLRFNRGSADHLTRSVSASSTTKATYSVWFKKTINGVEQCLYAIDDGTNEVRINFTTSDTIQVFHYASGYTYQVATNRVFRDPSAFYNIMIVVDTTQGTDTNRVKIYVNGVQETSLATTNYPSQNTDSFFFQSATLYLGVEENGSSNPIDGYIAENIVCQGQALTPTDVGEFDEDSGIWKPIDVSGLTFGTNGFYLDFENSGALGNDAAGSNNFTVNNLTAIDQSTDTCTTNFATMNPLRQPTANPATFSNGNLTVQTNTSNGYYGGRSTIGVSSGKWYFEAKLVSYSALTGMIGIQNVESYTPELFGSGQGAFAGFSSTGLSYTSSGTKVVNNSSTSYGDTYAAGDIISVALNLEDNEVKFYKNGTVQNSGTAISITAGLTYVFAVDDESSGRYCVWDCNFGSPSFAISSGNADGNGYGNFEYAVPANYYSLNTKNLAEYG